MILDHVFHGPNTHITHVPPQPLHNLNGIIEFLPDSRFLSYLGIDMPRSMLKCPENKVSSPYIHTIDEAYMCPIYGLTYS